MKSVGPGLLLFVAACGISDPHSGGVTVQVTGTVTWAGVSIPVSGVSVELWRYQPHMYDPGVNAALLASATTDAAGKYSITQRVDKCDAEVETFSIFANHPDIQGGMVAGAQCKTGLQVVNIEVYPRQSAGVGSLP